jgi:hypothetical protein
MPLNVLHLAVPFTNLLAAILQLLFVSLFALILAGVVKG